MEGDYNSILEILSPKENSPADLNDRKVENLHRLIIERLPKSGESLASAAHHHFKAPGKMLRGKMALCAARSLKIDPAAALHWAVAIEVLHNASLIHDDICDGDNLRRGRPSVWSKFGCNVALTLGDWLIALAFELAAEAGQRAQTPLLVKILAQHMATTTAGVAAEFSSQSIITWDSYLDIAADKTAPLLTAPLEGVAAMALHVNAAAAIGVYFRSLGVAYQIANDILNFRALDGAADCGSDLARRAPNAVIVLYRAELSDGCGAAFDAWFAGGSNVGLHEWQRNVLASDALAQSAHQMHRVLAQTERFAKQLPVGLAEVISPVQAMLKQVCLKSVAPVNC